MRGDDTRTADYLNAVAPHFALAEDKKFFIFKDLFVLMERVMGIEPTLEAWEAAVLPLNYTRLGVVPHPGGRGRE